VLDQLFPPARDRLLWTPQTLRTLITVRSPRPTTPNHVLRATSNSSRNYSHQRSGAARFVLSWTMLLRPGRENLMHAHDRRIWSRIRPSVLCELPVGPECRCGCWLAEGESRGAPDSSRVTATSGEVKGEVREALAGAKVFCAIEFVRFTSGNASMGSLIGSTARSSWRRSLITQ
jgi:hypothetical protein